MPEDRRLTKLTKLFLSFPEASVERSGDHATFKVRKKVFAYFLNDHHGDGIVSVCCKTALGEHEDLARAEPEKFYLPAYIGPRGWVGIRLDRGPIDWNEIERFAGDSYDAAAPKTLRALRRGR